MNRKARSIALITALKHSDPQEYWKVLRNYRVQGWYKVYLATDHWKAVRERTMRRDKYRCQRCGSRKSLEVHHLNYDRVGKERLGDLVTLCYRCHRREHEI